MKKKNILKATVHPTVAVAAIGLTVLTSLLVFSYAIESVQASMMNAKSGIMQLQDQGMFMRLMHNREQAAQSSEAGASDVLSPDQFGMMGNDGQSEGQGDGKIQRPGMGGGMMNFGDRRGQGDTGTVDIGCAKTAVTAREALMLSAWNAYIAAMTAAMQTRAGAVSAAWSGTDMKTITTAVSAANGAFQKASKAAQSAMKTANQTAVTAFQTAIGSCKTAGSSSSAASAQ